MKLYFQTQFTIINRTLTELGSKPIFAYPLGTLLFIGLSLLLFIKTKYALNLYCVLALSLVYKMSEVNRNEFLKITYKSIDYIKIRLIENCIIILPFFLFIIYKSQYLFAFILVILACLLSFFQLKNPLNYSIPTPFSKTPFEFPVGFRKTFYLFPIAYFLTVQSVFSGNLNLGIASILLIGLVVISYYSRPENELYIWNYCLNPKQFLIHKIKIGLTFFSYLILPILIVLCLLDFHNFDKVLLFTLISYVYILTIILAKYSAYPYKINIIEGLFIGVSLVFIPLLIVIIPLLYSKAVKQLDTILNDDKN